MSFSSLLVDRGRFEIRGLISDLFIREMLEDSRIKHCLSMLTVKREADHINSMCWSLFYIVPRFHCGHGEKDVA